MHLLTSLCVMLSIIYWLYRLIRALYNLLSYFNIRAFYAQALDIKPVERQKLKKNVLYEILMFLE